MTVANVRKKSNGRQRQRGNTMVESAFALLPLFILIFGIIDFSMAIFLRSTLQNAVREGVRYAVTYQLMSGSCQDDSIRTVVKNNSVGFINSSNTSMVTVRYYVPSNLTTPVTGTNSNFPGNVVEIGVEGYNWNWMAPLSRGSSALTMNLYSADVMEGLPGGVNPPCR